MNPSMSRRLRPSVFDCKAAMDLGPKVTSVPSIKRILAAVTPATTVSPAIIGQEGTPAAITPAPLNWKFEELVMDATGAAANAAAVSRNSIALFKTQTPDTLLL